MVAIMYGLLTTASQDLELTFRQSTCYTIVSLGTLTGLPIAGALLEACNGKYWGLVLFTGMCYVISYIAFSWVRVMKQGWGLKKVY